MAQSSPASACPSSSIPSRPPSRQSTRIITPVKTHANYVRPNNDTQSSLVRHVSATSDHKVSSDSHQPVIQSKRPSKSAVAPSSSTQVETATPSQINTTLKSKKRKRATANDSDPDVAVMDLTQDSDPKNKKAQKKIKKTRGVGLKDIDDIALYFEPPFRGKEETSESESDDPPAGYSDVSNSGSESGDAVSESKSTTKKSKLSVILSKVDLVIQRITSSTAKRSKFKVWFKKLDHNGPSLIAGHGIQWNIRWESRKQAFQACKVITKLIENKRDRQERDGGENFFQDHKISCSKWDLVKRLNDILKQSHHVRDTDDKDLFPDASESPADDELTSYLGGKYKIPLANSNQALKWWKEHHQDFPVLLLMARDYLACSATSASVERCFSAAANICAEDCGSLAPRTIDQCVNSHQWLQKGYQANGDFQMTQSIITQGMDDLKTKNKRPKACNIERGKKPLTRD
ncbi:hypothetical protein PCASD_24225 [Puccinia coronata f. sp. avenae]|uniref:HAT C-terminal dimerisation domain-containing protein n=1 Tax=Puccinia coronata f. sp. avenae TaxID=200324 RepID=A0A2N5SSZ8_9BASI|nr:hypothetical protein PCASD_24225 [Puccinia coronata f. sp. avenae]